MGLRDLGEHAAPARCNVSRHRPSQRVLSAFHSAELFREGSGTRRRLRQGMRGRYAYAPGGGCGGKNETCQPVDGAARDQTYFGDDHRAIPVFSGEKSESERFPGAVQTLTIEAMVQDRKAIQAGTSHFLGQNFARASGIQFQNREGKQEFGWTTSWGVTTRLIGTALMMHGDDDGAVLPPRIAPTQIVILPITPKEQTRAAVLEACDKIAARLRETHYAGLPIEVFVDRRDLGGGVKNWEWIKKGVALRVEIGPRDLEKNSVEL